MFHPAKANQPISSSFNVMGPHPLHYPPNFAENNVTPPVTTEPAANTAANNVSKEVQVQTDIAIPGTSSAEQSATARKLKKYRYDYSKADRHSEMNEDRPQDLSCNRESPLAANIAENNGEVPKEGEISLILTQCWFDIIFFLIVTRLQADIV